MAHSMYVEMESLEQLRAELEAAYIDFDKSFNDLSNGIYALTQKGFMGEGAVAFKQSFEGQPKSALNAVKVDTRNAIDYMDGKIASFRNTLNRIDEIASGNR